MTKIKGLKEEIFLVQLDTFTNKFDTNMKKENEKTKKWLKIAFIPFGISALASLITLNTIPVIIGTMYMGGVSIVKIFKDGEEFERSLRDKYRIDPNVTKLSEEIDGFDFLEQPIVTKKEEDFISDELKDLMNESKKPIFTIVGEEPDQSASEEEIEEEAILDKNEAIIRLADEYRTYKRAYKLPKLSMTNQEWDLLFETLYNRLEEVSLENKFYEYSSLLQRYVLADALVNSRRDISIYSYLNALPLLERIGLKDLNIPSIIEEIKSHLKPTKIYQFPTLRKIK